MFFVGTMKIASWPQRYKAKELSIRVSVCDDMSNLENINFFLLLISRVLNNMIGVQWGCRMHFTGEKFKPK